MLYKIIGQCTLLISFQIGLIQAQLQSLAESVLKAHVRMVPSMRHVKGHLA